MLSNSWFKKEKPLQSLAGMGGGLSSPLGAGGGAFEATGGTKTTNGSVVTHVFKTSGTLEVSGCPPSGVAIEYLVVGGGGAGIFYGSGGGATHNDNYNTGAAGKHGFVYVEEYT